VLWATAQNLVMIYGASWSSRTEKYSDNFPLWATTGNLFLSYGKGRIIVHSVESNKLPLTFFLHRLKGQ
jgi:hypothetical protein